MIEELFLQKKWTIDDKSFNGLTLFDRFCERLRLLDSSQQKFIIELTRGFTRINLSEYLEKFYESLFCLGDDIFDKKSKIFVFPLIKPYLVTKKVVAADEGLEKVQELKIRRGKTKSANFLYYMFATDDWTWISNKFIHSDSLKKLSKDFKNEDSILILIDDYVGSGLTAIEACREYLSLECNGEEIAPENIKVVSIAAQAEGVENVKKTLAIDVVSDIILKKGITDAYNTDDAGKMLLVMKSIENIIGGIKEEYSFGMGRSEALITFLGKTPNNTFPVYWHETKTKAAPFPRYRSYSKNG